MPILKPILLVEDSANDIELTRAALEDSNVANPLVVLRNGVEALDYIATHGDSDSSKQPVVVLLDIKMPKVSGIEVLRTLKSNPKTAQLPVVMLTSSREGPDIDECYRIGANAYVVKPVEFEEFSRAVKVVGRFWAVVNQAPQANSTAFANAATR
jgi:two-component system, response regulator